MKQSTESPAGNALREVVVISGKGGTGKTSLAASFVALSAQITAIADCDVDAADLGFLLAPKIEQERPFISGHQALIRQAECTACGACYNACRFGGIKRSGRNGAGRYEISTLHCEGCGVCLNVCPADALDFQSRHCGFWYESSTAYGPLVHAELQGMAENSGKLVTVVRQRARQIAAARGLPLLITDGPPGTGCPVIASITGSSLVVVVTEPTCSGEHDLKRVLSLTRFFNIPTAICINKWDINPEQCLRIEKTAYDAGALVAGRIGYDQSVTLAQMAGEPVVDFAARRKTETSGSGLDRSTVIADEIKQVWRNLARFGALPLGQASGQSINYNS